VHTGSSLNPEPPLVSSTEVTTPVMLALQVAPDPPPPVIVQEGALV
jgi:hypothetical protein